MAVTSVSSNGKALIIIDGSSTYNLQKKDVFSLNTNAGIVYVDTTTKGTIFVPVSVATQATIQAYLDALSDLGTVDVGNFPATYPNGLVQGLTDAQLRAANIDVAIQNFPSLSFPNSITANRSVPFPLYIAIQLGLVDGYIVEQKSGRNTDIDTGTVPEDVWNGGGAYTGFPSNSSPEEFTFVSSSASDTGVLSFIYLASNVSTAWQTGTVTLNGTTPVNSGISGIRIHSARYNNSSTDTFNVGTITGRHRNTVANVFFAMPIGTSQTYTANYTIPFGSTGHLMAYDVFLQGSTTAYCEGAFWIRTNGASPRLRRNFSASIGASYQKDMGGAFTFPALTDIMIRITNVSANNTVVVAGYDLILIPNA